MKKVLIMDLAEDLKIMAEAMDDLATDDASEASLATVIMALTSCSSDRVEAAHRVAYRWLKDRQYVP